jgi:MFS family permease
LGAATTLPFLLFGLLVGVWADRRERRRVLIFADLGRGAMIAAIAALGISGLLQLIHLYVLSFFIGVLTVFFDVAYQAYLPSIVERTQLVDANSKLETSNTLAGTTGPTLAGAVIHALQAPFAMLFDAASFFLSAASLAAIRGRETITKAPPGVSILAQIREGLQVVVGDRRLRHIAMCTAWANFFGNAIFGALLFILLKELGFVDVTLGLLFSLASIGGVLGALVSARIAERIGVGRAIVLGAVLFGFPMLPLPFLTAAIALPALALMLGASTLGNLIYNINQVSFRQAIVPIRLQGRLNATMRTIVWGTLPLGALTGGFLGVVIGLRPAILLSVVAGSVSFLWVLFSPVRAIREMPETAE